MKMCKSQMPIYIPKFLKELILLYVKQHSKKTKECNIACIFTPTKSENYLNYQEKEETGGHWKFTTGSLLNTNSHFILLRVQNESTAHS